MIFVERPNAQHQHTKLCIVRTTLSTSPLFSSICVVCMMMHCTASDFFQFLNTQTIGYPTIVDNWGFLAQNGGARGKTRLLMVFRRRQSLILISLLHFRWSRGGSTLMSRAKWKNSLNSILKQDSQALAQHKIHIHSTQLYSIYPNHQNQNDRLLLSVSIVLSGIGKQKQNT